MAHEAPIGDLEVSVPVQEGLRRIVPEASIGQAGSALEQLGFAAHRAQQSMDAKDAAAYAAKALPALRVAAETHLQNAQTLSQDELDKNGGLTPTVMKAYGDSVSAAIEGAPNAVAKQMMARASSELGADLQIRTMKQDAALRIQQKADGAIDGIDRAATAVELNPDSWRDAGGDQHALIGQMGLDLETTRKLQQDSNTEITAAAGRGYAKIDPRGTLARLNDPNDELFAGLDAGTRKQVSDYATGQLVQQTGDGILNVFRNQGPQAGGAAFAQLEKSDLTDQQKDLTRQHVNAGLSQLNEQRRTQYADQLTNLETHIATGNAPPDAKAQADGLYHAYVLDQSQYAAMLTNIQRSHSQADADYELFAHGATAFANHTALDPKDPNDVNSVNSLFFHMIGDATPSTAAYANAAVAITANTGIIPKDAVSWARAQLTSGSPAGATAAANVLARLEATNPYSYDFAIGESDKTTKAMVSTINNAVQAGTDPQVALNMARANAALPPAAIEGLKTQWDTAKAKDTQVNALSSILKSDPAYKPHFYSGLPTPPPLMQGQFDQLTRQYYDLTGGNLNQSRELAAQDLKRTWGVSEVNGKKELMQYAPEVMFPGLTASAVREDIANAVKSNASPLMHIDPQNGKLVSVKPDPSKISLIATDQTARSGGQLWQLGAPDQFGAKDVLRGADGNPLIYRLPVTGNDQAAQQARQNAAAMQSARKQQATGKSAKQAAMNEIDAQRGAPINRLNY